MSPNRSLVLFTVVGVVLWLAVTAIALLYVLEAPGERLGLAVGLVLCWVLLAILAALSRFTEHIGRGPR